MIKTFVKNRFEVVVIPNGFTKIKKNYISGNNFTIRVKETLLKTFINNLVPLHFQILWSKLLEVTFKAI